ncbi:putative peroxisomal fatty acid beta-oxidation multifunctional protein AIM1-like [Capsicum annuum]|nr:putative peroxisomal fatty acid beta-oxidation multifunctional protein AIM1-like [Capsicum annuum]
MSPALAKSVEDYHKGVKYLHESGIQRVPKKYIFPISERPNSSYTINGKPKMSLPIIDFSQLHGPNRVQVLDSLSYACENYGFFQLVNHGIPEEVIRSMVDVGGKFFDLPLVEREKYMTTDMTTPVRYGTSFNQTNDGVFCWRDFLKLVCEPLHDVLPHWPSSPSDFREMAIAYSKETKILFIKLVEAILESLGINVTTKNKTQQQNDDVEEILKEFEDGSQLMAINFYPPCPNPNLTLGMPPHSDYGFLTLLLQDEVEGLQVKFNGDWVTIQPIPGSFVVNVGDHLESGDLDCAPSDVVISYVMHSREKVNPTIINSDVRVLTYIMDADVDSFRPILRINVVERSFEGPLNSSAPPPRRLPVDADLIDEDLNDYENDVDDTINMEDYSLHMKDFSSDWQDDEEDRETKSQAGHSFTDATNFCYG